MENHDEFKQIKYKTCDFFHGKGHTGNCPCNPNTVLRLKRRFNRVNTSAAEQVFSWFKNYARILNEARPVRHRFKVLLFCRLHNKKVERGDTSHLNQYTKKRQHTSKPYSCNKASKKTSNTLKTMKTMKTTKAMKAMKAMKFTTSMRASRARKAMKAMK